MILEKFSEIFRYFSSNSHDEQLKLIRDFPLQHQISEKMRKSEETFYKNKIFSKYPGLRKNFKPNFEKQITSEIKNI